MAYEQPPSENGNGAAPRVRSKESQRHANLLSGSTDAGGIVDRTIIKSALEAHMTEKKQKLAVNLIPEIAKQETLTDMAIMYNREVRFMRGSFNTMYGSDKQQKSTFETDVIERETNRTQVQLGQQYAQAFVMAIKDEMKNRGELTPEQEALCNDLLSPPRAQSQTAATILGR